MTAGAGGLVRGIGPVRGLILALACALMTP